MRVLSHRRRRWALLLPVPAVVAGLIGLGMMPAGAGTTATAPAAAPAPAVAPATSPDRTLAVSKAKPKPGKPKPGKPKDTVKTVVKTFNCRQSIVGTGPGAVANAENFCFRDLRAQVERTVVPGKVALVAYAGPTFKIRGKQVHGSVTCTFAVKVPGKPKS